MKLAELGESERQRPPPAATDFSRTKTAEEGLDLGVPALYATTERYRRWEEFVERDAVVWSPPGSSPSGFYSVFSHQACCQLLRADAPVTSRFGMVIGFDASHPDPGGGRMIVQTDGQKHRLLRKLLAPMLQSQAGVSKLTSLVRHTVASEFGRLRGLETCDVASSTAAQIPGRIVCELLGVPHLDRAELMRLTTEAFASPDAEGVDPGFAHTQIFAYFHDLLRGRTSKGLTGIAGLLADSPSLDDVDALMNCYNLLIGGNQTTRHALAACFHGLALHPELFSIARQDGALMKSLTEEILRWSCPGMHVLRVTTSEMRINDVLIPKGSPVVAWLGAACRDPAVFPNATRVVPARTRNPHLAFGHGAHNCLGANVARLEISQLLGLMAAELSGVELLDTPEWMESNHIQGYKRLDVALTWSN